VGGTLSFTAPYAPENATVEVQLTVNTVLGDAQGLAPATAAPLHLPVRGFDGCACAGARANVVLPPPPAGLPPPEAAPEAPVGGVYRPAAPLPTPLPPTRPWPPAPPPGVAAVGALTVARADGGPLFGEAAATYVFAAEWLGGPPGAAAGATYTWRALLLTGCGGHAEPTCAYSPLAEAVGAGGRVLTLTMPATFLGPWKGGNIPPTSLLVEAVVQGGDYGAAARLLLPAAGTTENCDCVGKTLVRSAQLALASATAGVAPPCTDFGVRAIVGAELPPPPPPPPPPPLPPPPPSPSPSPSPSRKAEEPLGEQRTEGSSGSALLSGGALIAVCVCGGALALGSVAAIAAARAARSRAATTAVAADGGGGAATAPSAAREKGQLAID
jgi:hypothetical protein